MKMTLFIDETCATLNGKVSYESTTVSQFFWLSAGWRRSRDLARNIYTWGFWVVYECLNVLNHVCSTLSASWAIFDTMAAWRPQLKRCILNFQHDNILPLSAKTTLAFLWSIGIKGDRLLQCPVYYPELSSIENFWGILNQAFYHIKKQCISKKQLLIAINVNADNVMCSEIIEMTSFGDKKLK